MVAKIGAEFVLADFFSGLGLGMILAIFYDLLRLFFGSSKIAMLLCDFFTFVLAGTAVFSYCVTMSYSGIIRWYIVLSFLLGYIGYMLCIMPATNFLKLKLYALLGLPFKLIYKYIIIPILKFAKGKKEKRKAKKQKQLQNKNNKPLHKNSKVLYNSN